jgi:class 3 adenylate cyclase
MRRLTARNREDAEQLRDAVLSDKFAGVAAFRAECPDVSGRKRGSPEIDSRVGSATGDSAVANIGSEQIRNCMVIGDTANMTTRVSKAPTKPNTRAC